MDYPRARFQLADGPGSQGTVAAQFNCEGTTLSGVEFELNGAGYRVSLVKRRFVSGKKSILSEHIKFMFVSAMQNLIYSNLDGRVYLTSLGSRCNVTIYIPS